MLLLYFVEKKQTREKRVIQKYLFIG